MSPDTTLTRSSGSDLLLYQTEGGRTRLEVRLEGETVWLSLGQMAELFQRDKSVISRHVRNVFEEGELSSVATVANFATVQREASRDVVREVDYYNLDVIISVGYRVKSHRGTQFRIWATQRLRELIVKGFTLDDERLKSAGGGNYFDELLVRIRKQSVRSSGSKKRGPRANAVLPDRRNRRRGSSARRPEASHAQAPQKISEIFRRRNVVRNVGRLS